MGGGREGENAPYGQVLSLTDRADRHGADGRIEGWGELGDRVHGQTKRGFEVEEILRGSPLPHSAAGRADHDQREPYGPSFFAFETGEVGDLYDPLQAVKRRQRGLDLFVERMSLVQLPCLDNPLDDPVFEHDPSPLSLILCRRAENSRSAAAAAWQPCSFR